MNLFEKITNPQIQNLEPYQPGKPISELERELRIKDIIKMASNENPLGPSPKAIKALKKAAEEVHIYPDGSSFELKRALCSKHNLAAENLIIGNGSDELFHLIAHAFITPGDEVMFSDYAFASYAIATKAYGGVAKKIPAENYGHDIAGFINTVSARTKIIFLANPNNPTGTWFDKATFENLLANIPKSTLVVYDQAYFEYMDDDNYPDGLLYQKNHPNLIVTRTFSKIYALAGLRIGYGVCHPQVCKILNKVRLPFNLNLPATNAAIAALNDKAHVQESLAICKAGKKQLEQGFSQLGFEIISKHGNFVTMKLPMPGKDIFNALLHKGIIVRPLDAYQMSDCLRVTIGLEQDNLRLLEAIKQLVHT